MTTVREHCLRAQDFDHLRLLRKAFHPWKKAQEKRERQRVEKAEILYRSLLLRRGMQAWKEVGRL